MATQIQQQASVCWLSIHLCVDLCSVLNYLNVNKGDLVIKRKLHRKRQAGVEAIKSSEKISYLIYICRVNAGHPEQNIVNISLA